MQIFRPSRLTHSWSLTTSTCSLASSFRYSLLLSFPGALEASSLAAFLFMIVTPEIARLKTSAEDAGQSIHDVVAAIDVDGVPVDHTGAIGCEKGSYTTDVLDADELACRRLLGRLGKQLVEGGKAGRGARLQRARRDGVHADALGPKLGSHVADARLERSLHWPH